MLTVLAIAVVAVVVITIAVAVVAREGRRLATTPPPPVFSLDEAYAWVADRIPDAVAATLTPQDVKAILAAQVAHLRDAGVVGGTSRGSDDPAAVVDLHAAVAEVIARTRQGGDAYLPEQIRPVIDALFRYMEAIGAIAGPATDDEPSS